MYRFRLISSRHRFAPAAAPDAPRSPFANTFRAAPILCRAAAYVERRFNRLLSLSAPPISFILRKRFCCRSARKCLLFRFRSALTNRSFHIVSGGGGSAGLQGRMSVGAGKSQPLFEMICASLLIDGQCAAAPNVVGLPLPPVLSLIAGYAVEARSGMSKCVVLYTAPPPLTVWIVRCVVLIWL